MGRTENRPKDYERAVVVEHEMKETNEDHSLEWQEKSVQKGFDRADIVRDVRFPRPIKL